MLTLCFYVDSDLLFTYASYTLMKNHCFLYVGRNVNYTTGVSTDYSSYKLRLGCKGNEEDVSECNVYETYCSGNPYNGVNIVCNG